jgi:hypothetical protein
MGRSGGGTREGENVRVAEEYEWEERELECVMELLLVEFEVEEVK